MTPPPKLGSPFVVVVHPGIAPGPFLCMYIIEYSYGFSSGTLMLMTCSISDYSPDAAPSSLLGSSVNCMMSIRLCHPLMQHSNAALAVPVRFLAYARASTFLKTFAEWVGGSKVGLEWVQLWYSGLPSTGYWTCLFFSHWNSQCGFSLQSFCFWLCLHTSN